ncbi:hypothetical protein [Kitasatospora herbaricolor]|uniref:hypothetical protein n=1 Tax=Kitasatospora herbaricolor TaxID=68217 RepID=UPI0036D9CA33
MFLGPCSGGEVATCATTIAYVDETVLASARNTGQRNTGRRNTGRRNTGRRNTGRRHGSTARVDAAPVTVDGMT